MMPTDTPELSAAQVLALHRIALATAMGLRHDLNQVFTAIQANAQVLERWYQRAYSLQEIEALRDETLEVCRDIIQDVRRGGTIVRSGLSFDREASNSDPFSARPQTVAEEIRRAYPGTRIHIAENSSRSIQIVYPASSLFAVMHELIANAVRHSSPDVEVALSWDMCAERFRCSIEDSGPGLSKDLSSSYLPLDALSGKPPGGRGLQAVAAIVAASRGLLLFRRSTLLGGTQVLIEFPVFGSSSVEGTQE